MLFRKKKRVTEMKKIKDGDSSLLVKTIYKIDMNTGTNIKVCVFVV